MPRSRRNATNIYGKEFGTVGRIGDWAGMKPLAPMAAPGRRSIVRRELVQFPFTADLLHFKRVFAFLPPDIEAHYNLVFRYGFLVKNFKSGDRAGVPFAALRKELFQGHVLFLEDGRETLLELLLQFRRETVEHRSPVILAGGPEN